MLSRLKPAISVYLFLDPRARGLWLVLIAVKPVILTTSGNFGVAIVYLVEIDSSKKELKDEDTFAAPCAKMVLSKEGVKSSIRAV